MLQWGLDVNAAYIISIALLVIAAYLIGSLNFGIIISSKLYHSDVRSSGSGNAGRNMFPLLLFYAAWLIPYC